MQDKKIAGEQKEVEGIAFHQRKQCLTDRNNPTEVEKMPAYRFLLCAKRIFTTSVYATVPAPVLARCAALPSQIGSAPSRHQSPALRP